MLEREDRHQATAQRQLARRIAGGARTGRGDLPCDRAADPKDEPGHVTRSQELVDGLVPYH